MAIAVVTTCYSLFFLPMRCVPCYVPPLLHYNMSILAGPNHCSLALAPSRTALGAGWRSRRSAHNHNDDVTSSVRLLFVIDWLCEEEQLYLFVPISLWTRMKRSTVMLT